MPDAERVCTLSPVLLRHCESFGRVTLLLSVRSAHCVFQSSLRTLDEGIQLQKPYLEEVTVAAVKFELNGHVRAVSESTDTGCSEVDGETEGSFARDLEERDCRREILEARRVLESGEENSD